MNSLHCIAISGDGGMYGWVYKARILKYSICEEYEVGSVPYCRLTDVLYPYAAVALHWHLAASAVLWSIFVLELLSPTPSTFPDS